MSSLVLNIFGRDVNATRTIQRIGTEAEGAGKKASKALAGIGIGAAIGVGESIKSAGNYQAAVTRLQTAAGETHKNLGMVSSGMLSLATQTGTSTKDLSAGMYMVESAGYHGAAGLTVLKSAAQGARVEGADLNTVANAFTTAMNDTHTPVAKSSTLMSQLVATVAQGKMRMDDLAGSLHSVLPNAMALHIAFPQVAGALATMTRQGISADQAAQNLNHMIVKLAAPTQQMTKYMAMYGLSSQDVSKNLGKRGLTGTIGMLQEAAVKYTKNPGLINAFNQSKSAGQDLQIMLKNMSPTLRNLSEQYLQGKLNYHDYRGELTGGYGGKQLAAGMEFLTLSKQAQGFNEALRSGQPAAQTYTAALKGMLGDQTSLQVALHLGGENAAGFNASVNKIAHTTADANGNVKDFAEVSKTFNFQLSQMREIVERVAIWVGSHLIPALSTLFTWGERNSSWLGPMAIGIAALWTAWKGYTIISRAYKAVDTALTALRAKFGQSAATAEATSATTAEAAEAEASAVEAGAAREERALLASVRAYQRKAAAATEAATTTEGSAAEGGAAESGVGAGLGTLGLVGGAVTGVALLTKTVTRFTDAAANRMFATLGQLKDAQDDWEQSLVNTNGALNDETKLEVGKQLQDSGLAQKAAAAGISLKTLVGGITGNDAAFKRLIATWKASGTPADATILTAIAMHGAYSSAAAGAKQLASLTGDATKATKGQTSAARNSVPAIEANRAKFIASATAAGMNRDEVLRLAQSLYKLPKNVPSKISLNVHTATAQMVNFSSWYNGYISRMSARVITPTVAPKGAAGGSLIPGAHAQGTGFARDSLSWVGERGPELVSLPHGSQVLSHSQSASMTGGGGSQSVTEVHVHFSGMPLVDKAGVERAVAAALVSAGKRGVPLAIGQAIRR